MSRNATKLRWSRTSSVSHPRPRGWRWDRAATRTTAPGSTTASTGRPSRCAAGVGAGVTEVEGDPVDAGLQVVPLGPGSIWMSAKPAPLSTRGQSIRFLASNRSSSGTFGCQLVSTSRRPGRRIRRASTAAAAGSAAKWNASIDTAASALACGGPVWARSPTTNRARPASPNSAAGVRPDRPRRVRNPPLPTRQPPAASHSPGPARPHPRSTSVCPGDRPRACACGAADRPRRRRTGRSEAAGQARPAPRPAGSPGRPLLPKNLIEVGGGQRGRAGSGRDIIVLRHRSSPGHPRVHESLSPSTSEGESGRPDPHRLLRRQVRSSSAAFLGAGGACRFPGAGGWSVAVQDLGLVERSGRPP